VGLPHISTILVGLFLLLTTLTSGNRRTIPPIVGIYSRIIGFTATILTMLTTTGANVLKINRNTAAITNKHSSLFLSSTSYIDIIPKET
jgi:hypothetical protein